MRTFDLETLAPSGGSIYGHLFENVAVNVPRAVYWAVEVNFEPIKFLSEEWTASLCCEWIQWPIRDWKELDGQAVAFPHSLGAEASMYVFSEHQPVSSLEVVMKHVHASTFELRFDARLDLVDPNGDVISGAKVVGLTEGRFEGLVVVRENLEPKPKTALAASQLLEPFADLSAYEKPYLDQFRWVFPPMVQHSAA